jgi:hypothetical protein
VIESFLKIAFGRPLLSEPLFAGRTTVARSEEYSICKMGGSVVGAATPEGLAPPEFLLIHPLWKFVTATLNLWSRIDGCGCPKEAQEEDSGCV